MLKINNENQRPNEDIMLSFDLDNFEVSSFVTGMNQQEKDSIENGYFLSCSPPSPGTTTPTVSCGEWD
jgi:hypothetical protein